MVEQPTTNIVLKSGLILEICKNPIEFFQSIRDDLYAITDELLIDNSELNERVGMALLDYFDEKFGV